MSRAILILTTVPDAKSGEKIARLLLQKKVAACISMKEGFVSHYRWKGKIESQKESLLLIKTARRFFSEVKKIISKNHAYAVPEILAFPAVEGSKKYLKWLESCLR